MSDSLLAALVAAEQRQAATEEFGNELERRLRMDWWTLPESESESESEARRTP